MTVLAHIAGVPVEEGLLYAGPMLATVGVALGAQLRCRLRRWRTRGYGGRHAEPDVGAA